MRRGLAGDPEAMARADDSTALGEAFNPIRLPKGRLPPECTQVNGIGGIAFPGTVR
jgi:hypothetical protein